MINNRLIAGGCDVTSEKKQWYFIYFIVIVMFSTQVKG